VALHTISRLHCQEVREGSAYSNPIDFANTVIDKPSGQATIWHGLREVFKTLATGASSGLEPIGAAAEAVCTGLAASGLADGVEVISPEILRASDEAGLQCGRAHHPRPFYPGPGTSGLSFSERAAEPALEGSSVTRQHRKRASVQAMVWTHAHRPVVFVIPASCSYLRKGGEAQSESESE
jgi:hypothetical protein